MSRKGMELHFTISIVNFTFLWKDLSGNNIYLCISIYPNNMYRQQIFSKSFTLSFKFDISDVSSSAMNILARSGTNGEHCHTTYL